MHLASFYLLLSYTVVKPVTYKDYILQHHIFPSLLFLRISLIGYNGKKHVTPSVYCHMTMMAMCKHKIQWISCQCFNLCSSVVIVNFNQGMCTVIREHFM